MSINVSLEQNVARKHYNYAGETVVVSGFLLSQQQEKRLRKDLLVEVLMLVDRGFFQVLRFPPLVHWFNLANGSANRIKLKINAI